jgi:hypothetical protein
MRKPISLILSLMLLFFIFTCADGNDLVEQSVKAFWKVSGRMREIYRF